MATMQQINVFVNDFSVSFIRPLVIIIINIVIFTVFFIFAYKKKRHSLYELCRITI